MSISSATYTAFNARLQSLVLDPVLPIAWPNVEFTRPNGDSGVLPYLSASMSEAPARPLSLELGDEGSDVHSGFYQVSVFWPINRGASAPKRVADQIVDWFRRRDLWEGSVRVRCGAAYVSAGVDGDVYYMVPVTVPWSVYT